jgi:hypothetical protein
LREVEVIGLTLHSTYCAEAGTNYEFAAVEMKMEPVDITPLAKLPSKAAQPSSTRIRSCTRISLSHKGARFCRGSTI